MDAASPYLMRHSLPLRTKKDAERLFEIEEEDIDELGLPYATAKVCVCL